MHGKLAQIAAASLLAAWLALPLPALADPPHWAPAHGYRAKQHHYIYYPRHEVYYAPASQLWFWLDDGRWRAGAYLPGSIVVTGLPAMSIVLGTERPWEMNTYVVERYGGRHGKHRHRHRSHDD